VLDQTPILGGYDETIVGIRIVEQRNAALVSLAIPLGGEAAAEKAIKSAFKLALPPVGQSAATSTHRLIRTGPDQALLLFDSHESGSGVRTALERLCPLDLHPDAFAVNTAQRTVMEHMGAMIVRTNDDQFLLMSASSSARSFLHAVETSITNTT